MVGDGGLDLLHVHLLTPCTQLRWHPEQRQLISDCIPHRTLSFLANHELPVLISGGVFFSFFLIQGLVSAKFVVVVVNVCSGP